ncbi:MAG: chromosomal replication initiator protein DnaA [Gammaproteobacteria bacterium]|nr:chromosomal replication initiator protein DnaA [Gammaproteobacteria bacterium]
MNDYSSAWTEVCEALKKRVPQQDYANWLSPLFVEEGQDGKSKGVYSINIKAENQYKMRWVVSRYGPLLEELFTQALDKKGRGRAQVIFSYKPKSKAAGPSISVSSLMNRTTRANNETEQTKYTSYIDSRHTLKNFIPCEANLLALELARGVIGSWSTDTDDEKPHNGASIICGASGLGKTHLLHSIANEINKSNKKPNIVYVTAEHFVMCMAAAMQSKNKSKEIASFKEAFSHADLLLVDDVQFFAGKEKTQQEFLHIFKTILESGKSLVVSCDQPPQKMGGLLNQLKTRLSRCLITPLDKPDVQARAQIVKANARKFNFVLDDTCCEYIAMRIDRSLRDLEGATKMVVFYAQTLKKEPSIDLINRALKDIIPAVIEKVSISRIQKAVAAHYDIPLDDLLSTKRHASITLARQMAMFLCRELTSHSTTEIGAAFGGKNHSTVLYSCVSFEKLLKQDKSGIKNEYTLVKNKIRGIG